MSKGTETRNRIVERAAPIFNTKGYAGASVADIMDAAELQKGGIYRHFASKQDLALAAFDFSVSQVGGRLRSRLADRAPGLDRLYGFVDAFSELVEDSPVAGGCPVMNAAIENDDGDVRLRARSREAMDRLLGAVEAPVAEAITAGEIRNDVEPRQVATIVISALEGALTLSRLFGDAGYTSVAAAHLREYIRRELVAASPGVA